MDLILCAGGGGPAGALAFIGGVGAPEILVILIVALIVLGPQRLPSVAKSLGKGLRELRRASEGLRAEIQDELNPVTSELHADAEALKDVGRDAAASAATDPADVQLNPPEDRSENRSEGPRDGG